MDFQQDLNRMVKLALKNYENAPMYKRSQENRLKAVGNIYFLFSDYELKYIGQRQLKGIKTRLDQHLYGKSYSVDKNNVQNGTISKWDKVKHEIDHGKEISFKVIHVKPDTLRTTIELELIEKLNPIWNIHGK